MTVYKTSTGVEYTFRSEYDLQVEAQPPRLYKMLRQDGTPPYAGGAPWPLPTHNPDGTWTPGDWVVLNPEGGTLQFCARGLHAFDGRYWRTWIDFYRGRSTERTFIIEYDGPVAFSQEKWLGARARLLREIDLRGIQKLRYHDQQEYVDHQLSTVKGPFLNRLRQRLLKANKELLGADYENVLKSGTSFPTNRFDERRRAYLQLKRALSRVNRLEGKPLHTPEYDAAAKEHKRMEQIMDLFDVAAPGEDVIKEVGQRWHRDLKREYTKALNEATAQAEADWTAMGEFTTFDEMVDAQLGQIRLPLDKPEKRGRL